MGVVKEPNGDRAAELVRDAAIKDTGEILQRLGSSGNGLSDEEAAERLEVFGANEVAQERGHSWLERIWVASRNPLVILLTLLATVSFATGDFRAGIVMLLMVVLGVALRFIQETKADNAAAQLKAMISVTATVVRSGQAREIPLRELVPGDVVKLCSGDMIPGDVRLMSAKDLFLIQATLTGNRCRWKRPTRRMRGTRFRPSSGPICVSSARAWRAARPRRLRLRPERRPISGRWRAAWPGSRRRRRSTRE